MIPSPQVWLTPTCLDPTNSRRQPDLGEEEVEGCGGDVS